MNEIFLSLGSNEGDRIQWLERAIALLAKNCGTIIKRSAVYQTSAWGITTQPDFLNMVVFMHTTLTPPALLTAILNIEITFGRQRNIKWGPRNIDIDILFYDDIILDTPSLTIPHPFLQERRFILVPLAEIAPDFIHPKLNLSISDLLALCNDMLSVYIYPEDKL